MYASGDNQQSYAQAHHSGAGTDDPGQNADSMEVPPEVLQPGKNFLKVKYILKHNVERNEMKEMFKDFIVHSDMTEIACIEIIRILEKSAQSEQEMILNAMVNYLLNTNAHLIPLDRLITKIFFAIYEKKVMPILPIAYGLIKSLDMRFRIPIDPMKVKFVREHLHEINYKGMRDLLKLALIDKLGSLKGAITEFQRLQLVQVEDLMLDLLNRNRNLCPSLFVITEISRIHHNTKNIYILPRLSVAIRNFVASFRPVAEVGSVLCRVWLYPVTTTLTYSWFGNTWRVLEGHSRIHVKTHLPYATEILTAQTYFEYMILRQPRAQFNMQQMLKFPYKSPFQCNEIMQVLVLEAMKATEDTKLHVKSELVQYNWRHLFHLVAYALCTNHGNFTTLLEYIKCHLDQLKFKRSRDELMWMILQYVSVAVNRQPLQPQIVSTIFDIFNYMYPDELSWTGSSSETWEMARFFAPACIWINLAMGNKSEDTQPPEKIASHIQYLESANKDINSDGLLVVMANAYSNREEVFNTEICHPIYKRLNSPTGHQQAVYPLPYGLQADGALECLDNQFLEALTFHAKQQLCYHLLYSSQQIALNGRCPSPAAVETISRITLKGEAMNTHGRTFTVYLLNRLRPNEKSNRSDLFTMLLYDLMVYRQKNAMLSPNNRCLFISCAYELMPATGQIVGEKLPLYVLMEQAIIRQFMVATPYDLLPMVALFTTRNFKGHGEQAPSSKFNLFTPTLHFFKKTNEQSICPEVSKLIMLYFIMGYKFTADYPSEGSLNDFISTMNNSFKWPQCSIQWFPKNIAQTAQADSMPDMQLVGQYEELLENEQNTLWHLSETTYMSNRPPVTFITILNSLINYPNMAFPPTTHSYLNSMSIMSLTNNLNTLVIYLILKARRVKAENEYEQMIRCLYKMIFVDRFVPFERFFLSLVMHPNDTDSIRASAVILTSLLNCEEKEEFRNNRGIMKRLHSLFSFLPSNSNLLTYNSEDYFKKLLAYRKEHADYDFERLQNPPSGAEFSGGANEQERNYRPQIPMYYSNIAERILPIVDVLFLRCFEVPVDKTVMETLLKAFAPIYRYHPQPVTFLYKLAYILDGNLPATKSSTDLPMFTRFVIAVCKKLDEERTPRYPFLTLELVVQQHNMLPIKICEVLVSRIVSATTYIHQPPEFIAKDWRIAEFTPASQALISSCLELMASPKSARELVSALVDVSMQRPLKRPYDKLNAVALILTNLPKRFQQYFFELVANSFEWEELKANGPDYLFSSYNVEVMQYSEDKIMSVLALVHAFIQHANSDTLALLCTIIGEQFAPKVENETQLIYFLRIMSVYLLKISDRDKANSMSDSSSQYLQLIISIYDIIPQILKDKPKLQYEDMVCDMLYLFKYTVMGYSVNKETEEAISQFPDSMKIKLKFLPSRAMRGDITSHHINKSIPHCTLMQLFDNNFQNIRDHSDLLPMPVTSFQQQPALQQPAQLQQQTAPNQQPAPSIPPNQPMPILHPNLPQTQQNQQPPSQPMPNQPPQQMSGQPAISSQQMPSNQPQQQPPQMASMPGQMPMSVSQPQASMPQPVSGANPAYQQFGGGMPQRMPGNMHPMHNQPQSMNPGMQAQFHAQQGMIPPQMMQGYQHQPQMMQMGGPVTSGGPMQQQGLPQPPPYFAGASNQRPPQLHHQGPQSQGSFDSGHPGFQQQHQMHGGGFGMQPNQMYHPGQGGPHQPGPMMGNRPAYMQPHLGSGQQGGQMPPRM